MPKFKNTALGHRLKKALEADDHDEIELIVRDIVDMLSRDELSREATADAIVLCQSNKQWTPMVVLAEALIAHDPQITAETQRRYAQALIELDALSAAECMLDALIRRDAQDQIDECLGLKGRIAKQRYLHFANKQQLRNAVNHYAEAMSQPEPDVVWAGTNLLSLLHRADQDGVALRAGLPSARRLEQDIRAAVEMKSPAERNIWQRSAEVVLAVHNHELGLAAQLAGELAQTTGATPFELGSLRRQLSEVWKLGPEHSVIRTLTNTTLEMGIDAEAPVPAPDDLEKILGTELPTSYDTYLRGLTFSQAVCMITDFYGTAVGTGFVLPGSALWDELPDDLVLLTNSHVISPDGFPNALLPERAMAHFTVLEDDGEVPVRSDLTVLWSSPPNELDATLLRIDAPNKLRELPIEIATMTPSANEADAFVFVIGHPQGKPLALSLRGNRLLAADDEKLHYLAPTEPGSSGSPVFDKAFRLVGLHHSGSRTMAKLDKPDEHYPANEAINIAAIRNALNERVLDLRANPLAHSTRGE